MGKMSELDIAIREMAYNEQQYDKWSELANAWLRDSIAWSKLPKPLQAVLRASMTKRARKELGI